jgi:hypothetical protein
MRGQFWRGGCASTPGASTSKICQNINKRQIVHFLRCQNYHRVTPSFARTLGPRFPKVTRGILDELDLGLRDHGLLLHASQVDEAKGEYRESLELLGLARDRSSDCRGVENIATAAMIRHRRSRWPCRPPYPPGCGTLFLAKPPGSKTDGWNCRACPST